MEGGRGRTCEGRPPRVVEATDDELALELLRPRKVDAQHQVERFSVIAAAPWRRVHEERAEEQVVAGEHRHELKAAVVRSLEPVGVDQARRVGFGIDEVSALRFAKGLAEWNMSPLVAFANLSAVGKAVPIHTGEAYDGPGTALVPPVRDAFRRLDGSEIEVEVTAIPFMDRGRASAHLVIREITERLAAQATARRGSAPRPFHRPAGDIPVRPTASGSRTCGSPAAN
mgnify:CR=1 FL=1